MTVKTRINVAAAALIAMGGGLAALLTSSAPPAGMAVVTSAGLVVSMPADVTQVSWDWRGQDASDDDVVDTFKEDGTDAGVHCVTVKRAVLLTIVVQGGSTYRLDWGGPRDINGDGDVYTDADVEAFFDCLRGDCCATCTADFNGDGDVGTDADIEAFWLVMHGSN